jgi:ABC-type dipeptide/oligopeptide/nickel transport system ATPase component
MSDEEFRQKCAGCAYRWCLCRRELLNPVMSGDQVAISAMVHSASENALSEAARCSSTWACGGFWSLCFELSGGMRQRVAIAMSLVTAPGVVILDEPTSALDVLTQANIFNVLKRLKQELEVSFVLITHDIATSSELADRVAVMYAGQIVEANDAFSFFHEPLHPYSRMLMASVPRLRAEIEPEYIVGSRPVY